MKGKISGIMLLALTAALTSACSGELQEESSLSENGTVQEPDDVEISLPEDPERKIDYTSVKGIQVEKGFYLAVIGKGLDSGYWQAVEEGAVRAVEDMNEELGYEGEEAIRLTFDGPEDNLDIDSQINTVDAVLEENPGALCLAAIDVNSFQAQLEMARDNQIPVVILDSGVESDLVVCSCVTDNRSAASEAARQLGDALKGKGQVLVAAHVKETETSEDRVAGFQKELRENWPEISLAGILYEEEDTVMEEMLAAALEENPGVKGIFCTNESMTESVLETAEQMGREDLEIVGFDAGEVQIQAIEAGRERGTVCQNPYGMGYAAVVVSLRAASGAQVDDRIDPGYQWICRENIGLEENRKYLYS
jgi:ribose transport system substrate-binding protein